MAVANGFGKTVTSGSVFMYDTGDTVNSYKGEPTVNLVPTQTISSWSNLVNVSSTGDSITPPINGLIVNRVSRTSTSSTYFYSGNTWATTKASFGYFKAGTITQVTILGNSYNAGTYATFDLLAGTITAYQTVTPFIENVGEGWYRCGFSVTNGPSYPFLITLNGYTNETVTSGQYLYICGTQCETKNHATPFTAGTRSATQGLLPLVGNSTIDLSNVSFDSNAQMVFDGTDDYIITSNMPAMSNWTTETIINLSNYTTSQKVILDVNLGIRFEINNGYFNSHFGNGSGWIYTNLPSTFTYTANTTYHIVVTVQSGGQAKMYINGILNNSTNIGSGTTPSVPLYIGRFTGASGYEIAGTLPVVKIYDRALSSSEVKQNYNKYKTRFNLS